MNTLRFSILVVAMAVLTGCVSSVPLATHTGSSAHVSPAPAYPMNPCTPPDWSAGEEWAQKANAGAGSTTTGSVERRFRGGKGEGSYYYDSHGSCVFVSDSYARSRRN